MRILKYFFFAILFTRIKDSIEIKDYETASNLQIEMKKKMKEVQQKYIQYQKNIF